MARFQRALVACLVVSLLLVPAIQVVPRGVTAAASPVTLPATFTDSLHSTSIDTTRWKVSTTSDTPGEIDPELDGVHFKLSGSSGGAHALNLTFLPVIQGDFDATVDFRLISWPAHNGSRAGMVTGQIGDVERTSFTANDFTGDESYLTDFYAVGQGPTGFTPAADLQGKLRFTRSGTTYAGYRWDGNNWLLISSYDGQASGDISDLTLGTWTNPTKGNQAVEVVFDNFSITVGASPSSVLITNTIPGRPVTTVGETFFTKTLQVAYSGGPVLLSSDASGQGQISVDDVMQIVVTHPDGTSSQRSFDFAPGCMSVIPQPPQDISDLFQAGTNTVQVILRDKCGGFEGAWALYLVGIAPPPSPSPSPSPLPSASPSPSPNPTQPSPCVSKMELVPVGPNFQMNDMYRVQVTVHNPADVSQPASFTLSEHANRTGDGDVLAHDFYGNIPSIPAGQDAPPIPLGPFSHSWHWLQPAVDHGGAGAINTVLGDALPTELDAIFDGATHLGDLMQIANLLDIGQVAVWQITYTYDVSLPACNSPVQASAKVRVTNDKLLLLAHSEGWSYAGGLLMGGALKALPDPVIAVAMGAFGAWLDVAGDAELGWSNDPDPNYATLVTPTPAILPDADKLTGQDAIAAVHLSRAIGYLNAAGAALAKYGGAAQAGDTAWMATQLQSARDFLSQEQYELAAFSANAASYNALQAQLSASGTTPAQLAALVQQQGLPPTAVDALTKAGYSPQAIQQLTTTTVQMLQHAQPADLTTDLTTRLENEAGALLGQVNADLTDATNGQADTTAPISTITPAGPQGAHGYYTGSVRVSLAAQDNAGGSGVAKIEYSLDSGTTWQPYTAPLTLGNDGDYTILSRATDQAGNIEFPPHRQDIAIDQTPPTVRCAAPDGQWHASDVSLACTASDGGSGLASAGDASFSLTTSVPVGTETANAATNSQPVCDVAGNCATAGPIASNKVDKKPPTISITTPASGIPYLLHQAVAVSYTCADGGSGVATCAGPVANGGALDTTSVGAKSFAVSAADKVGNAANQSVPYTVTYNVCPLYDPTQAKKAGSDYPIKLQVCDAQGANMSAAALAVTAVSITGPGGAIVPPTAAGDANPGNAFRFDPTLGNTGGYIYNLKTDGLAPGTYTLSFTVAGDPVMHTAQFEVR